ncbi:MAG: carboxypeptidase-like regulatory domain-containing protein [Bacteroidales bacterium]|nr:carboxypeptidase-like regulatory domain-containing protein [Bacteroidales bacterium]MBP9030235.1 carboxypeptidase-like regulatory domain-containing protein [Bacteroidales bacterium]
MKRLLTVSFIAFFCSNFALGQGQITKIRGKVLDAQTNEPLPYVNVTFKNTTQGTITSEKGEFFLESRTATDTLIVSFVGYKPAMLRVKKGVYQEVSVNLEPEAIELEAVVVKPGESQANRIIRNIIANKNKNNPANFSYSCKNYNKIQVDINNIDEDIKKRKVFNQFQFIWDYVDTNAVTGKTYLPIFITESLSDYYYRANPKMEKEIIRATKMSGVNNESVAQFTGKIYQSVNIYDNYINIFDQGLVSPISNSGMLFYKYILLDSMYIDNRWCYQISFRPRRKMEPTFTGDFWVNDSTWAIVKAQIRLSDMVNLNFVNDMVATAEFMPLNDTLWFPKQMTLFVDFNLTDKTTGFFGHKTISYSDVKLNAEFPKEVTDLPTNLKVEEGALNQEEEFWAQARPFELTPREANIYQMVDSVQQVPMYKTFIDIINMFVNYYYVVGYWEIGPYYQTYSFNEIEGNRFKVSGRTSNKFSKRVMFDAFVAYGDKDERFKWGVGALYMISKNPREAVGVSYKSDIEQLGQSPYALTEDNILTSFLRRNPNYKLTLVKDFTAYYEKEWFVGLSNKVTFSHRIIFPTEFIPFTPVSGGSSLKSITNATLTLNTRWIKDERFVSGEFEKVSLGSNWPEVNFNITRSIKGFAGSDYDFWKLHLNYYHKFNLNPIGYARFIVDAGKIFGKVPYPLLQLHEGNETYAFDRYAFNMMNYYEFASNQYVSLYYEHHFQGFFLNHFPLLRRLKWREVATAKYLIGSISNENMQMLQFPAGLGEVSKPYMEVSVGLENIFKVVRVDALWRLTHLDNPNIEPFGVRVGLQIIF